MHVLIATDAWHPQVNGVVRSLEATANAARGFGARVDFLTPQGFNTLPLPSYPEIPLSLISSRMARKRLDAAQPDHVHIATEGPIGLAARRACLQTGRKFTTSYHTRYPEYIAARVPLPLPWSYAWLRRFHNAGLGILVATPTLMRELDGRGFLRLLRWSRGVDHTIFRPDLPQVLDLPRPIFLYAGRVAVEKNLEAFLGLNLPGSKVIVGDGPARAQLQQRYPETHFCGLQTSRNLAALYASADVFVFPSRTDTFGMVLLEAMACGLPVAAFPVAGPLDVLGKSDAGVMDEDLQKACMMALEIPREAALTYARKFTWAASAREFLESISQARSAPKSSKERDLLHNGQRI